MKIAIDAYHALFQSGGIPRYTRGLISALAEIAITDDFILFYNRFRERTTSWKPESKQFKIRQIHFPRRLLSALWDKLNWPPIEILCGAVDLFHGLHFVLPPAHSARRVLTVHDLTFLKFPDYFTNQSLNKHGYYNELPKALNRADAVIAVSQKTREDLIELMKFPVERIRVIYEGVGQHFFKPFEKQKSDTIMKRYGLKRPYLIFLVGTPEPRKNIARTVEAFKKAASGCQLVLIGPQMPLKMLLDGDSHGIIFTGVVPEDHLLVLLSGAMVSLYPSLYEGFGLPVLESMACGIPVITSNRGSLPEVAGGAALIVNPEDVDEMAVAIIALLKDESLQQRLKVLGKRRASEFTWKKAAEATLSLYRELV